MLIRLAQEYGVHIATLQHVLEGYKVADEIAQAGIGGSTFSDWWGYKIEAYDAIPYNAALMAERGVIVSFNSDSDELARRLNLEAAKGVRYGGMSPVEALKAVTINPAKQLGIDKTTGSIEEGKDADLVVWSGDPLSTHSVCEQTFVDGQLLFDRAADIAARPLLDSEKKRLLAAEHPDQKESPAKPVIEVKPATVTAPAQLAHSRSVSSDSLTFTTERRGTGKGDAAPAESAIAIVGATVHPVTGPDIPNGVVLIQGEKIAAVGTMDSVKIPADAVLYQAKGMHVYPGLIDAETTIGLIEIDQYSSTDDSSEIGDFNPELRSVMAFNPDSERVGVVRQAGILTVGSVPKEGIISGMGCLMNTDGWTREDMAVTQNSALYINFPTLGFRRFGGTGDHGEDDTTDYLFDDYRAVGGAALQPPPGRGFGPRGRAGGTDAEENPLLKSLNEFIAGARRYKTARIAADPNLPPHARDSKLEAMLPVLDGKIPVFIHADREQDIRRAVNWATQNNLKMVLVGGQEADKCPEVLVQNNIPLVFGPVLNLPKYSDSPYDEMYALPGILAKDGIKVAITAGTDGDGEMTRRLAHHAAMASAFGLPPEEGLKAITLYPAQAFGVEDHLGSIEPGKDATLIVTTGDILEITSDIKAAWIKGHAAALTNKQTRLYEKYKARPKK
jgi:imidazolonepropionase-like amidohydrolase